MWLQVFQSLSEGSIGWHDPCLSWCWHLRRGSCGLRPVCNDFPWPYGHPDTVAIRHVSCMYFNMYSIRNKNVATVPRSINAKSVNRGDPSLLVQPREPLPSQHAQEPRQGPSFSLHTGPRIYGLQGTKDGHPGGSGARSLGTLGPKQADLLSSGSQDRPLAAQVEVLSKLLQMYQTFIITFLTYKLFPLTDPYFICCISPLLEQDFLNFSRRKSALHGNLFCCFVSNDDAHIQWFWL